MSHPCVCVLVFSKFKLVQGLEDAAANGNKKHEYNTQKSIRFYVVCFEMLTLQP